MSQASTTTVITSDNPDSSAAGQPVTVAFTVTANPLGSGTPTGTVTISDADGLQVCSAPVATGSCTIAFTAAGTHHLTATYAGSAGYTGSSSAPATTHTVVAGPANKLVFTTQPSNELVDATITPSVVVQVTDAQGNPTTLAGNVTLILSLGAGTLNGTATKAVDAFGQATFDNLSVTDVGTYTLAATSSVGLIGITSTTFEISPATNGLLADIATSDADFNHIDGFDVLFGTARARSRSSRPRTRARSTTSSISRTRPA